MYKDAYFCITKKKSLIFSKLEKNSFLHVSTKSEPKIRTDTSCPRPSSPNFIVVGLRSFTVFKKSYRDIFGEYNSFNIRCHFIKSLSKSIVIRTLKVVKPNK